MAGQLAGKLMRARTPVNWLYWDENSQESSGAYQW